MRIHLVWAVTLICTAPVLAQTTTPPKSNNGKPLTLVGCVERNETTPDQFNLNNPEDGTIYRLTGMKVGDFLGRRVQIVGGMPSKRFVVAGGLTPSANLAAQAGAIDQTRSANAAAAAPGGPGTVQLPEFRVRSVRPVTGTCPDGRPVSQG
jgi:hypothetical protein